MDDLIFADEIIKQHDGLLFIESIENVGTTVTVVLPIYEEPIVEIEPETDEFLKEIILYIDRHLHEKILLVDKEKAKYCYLTFSINTPFYSDNFLLTDARAMLHYTRREAKNRGFIVLWIKTR